MSYATDSERMHAEILSGRDVIENLSSRNKEMLHCLQLAQVAAKSAAPVMITGEKGVGKSFLAMSIHYLSPRRAEPCISVNCSTTREKDMMRLLFGGNGGGGEAGALYRAGGGTLIIDSVDLLPSPVQRELFSALTNWTKVSGRFGGGGAPQARIISISGNELAQKAANGLFSQELLFCLSEITIRMPPLRERPEDLTALTERALRLANKLNAKSVAGLSRTASDFISHYSFPGNVRELFMIINRAVRETARDTIYVEDLGLTLDPVENDSHYDAESNLLPLFEMEKRHIAKALLRTGWKKKAAARLLCITVSQLERKIGLYGLEKSGVHPG